ncbi:hypothetical protein MKW94_022985 [Papaver nudicaule]|uniref:MYB transcription factor n=1 Tax=Papaver nudicaule TaxID=74823 RepID=A0AA41V1A3_PAPNU|nr:hypothetical protein [Papaver nudicaule]
MGAPKQKWTAREEAALKAGILKHGPGKWRLILKDPEFSSDLLLRSNVDLKDKWRNMHAPRLYDRPGPDAPDLSRARSGHKKSQSNIKPDGNSLAFRSGVQSDDDILDVKPIVVANDNIPDAKLDSLIIEAIANLKERNGSSRTSIATYIEDQYCAPPNFKRILSAKLKLLVASGKLIKVKRNYRIAPDAGSSERSNMPETLLREARQGDFPDIDKDGDKSISKTYIASELEKMRFMLSQQADAAAARALYYAETCIANAELAAMEAEAAEADAEAAQAFAEAAKMTLKARNSSVVCA